MPKIRYNMVLIKMELSIISSIFLNAVKLSNEVIQDQYFQLGKENVN